MIQDGCTLNYARALQKKKKKIVFLTGKNLELSQWHEFNAFVQDIRKAALSMALSLLRIRFECRGTKIERDDWLVADFGE